MKFNHQQILTDEKKVSVGDKCQYYEDGYIANVEVVELWNTPEEIGFKLKVLSGLRGPWTENEIFTVSAARFKGAYSGMWRLYGPGEYVSITHSYPASSA